MLSVYNYKEPVSYINAYVDYLKSNDPDFTIKRWSKELGFTSTATIIDVLKGKKRLKGNILSKIMSDIPIDKSEVLYFQAINERSMASNSDEILMYDLLIEELKPNKDTDYSCIRNSEINLYSH